jgi:hypothetical protein
MILRLKAYMVKDATWNDAYAMVQAGENNAPNSALYATEAIVQLTMQEDRIQVRSGASTLTIDESFSWNSIWNIEISIDPLTRTWFASINGTRLSDNGVNVFDFRNNASITGINFVALIGYSGAAGHRVFWDDIVLEVPPHGTLITIK